MFSHVALQIEVLKYQVRFPHEQKSWSFFCKHSNMPQCKTAQLIVEVGRGGGQLIVEVGSNKKWLLKMNYIGKGHQCDRIIFPSLDVWIIEKLPSGIKMPKQVQKFGKYQTKIFPKTVKILLNRVTLIEVDLKLFSSVIFNVGHSQFSNNLESFC